MQQFEEADVRPSVGSAGDTHDNAKCESIFSTLEAERLPRRRFRSQAEARMACFVTMEGWHSTHPRNEAPGSVVLRHLRAKPGTSGNTDARPGYYPVLPSEHEAANPHKGAPMVRRSCSIRFLTGVAASDQSLTSAMAHYAELENVC